MDYRFCISLVIRDKEVHNAGGGGGGCCEEKKWGEGREGVVKKIGGRFFFLGGGGEGGVRASKIPVFLYIASISQICKLVSHNFSLYCNYIWVRPIGPL